MKSYKNLYPRVHSFANLYLAFRAARKGKRDRAEVAAFEFDLESNLLALQSELGLICHSQGKRVKWLCVDTCPVHGCSGSGGASCPCFCV